MSEGIPTAEQIRGSLAAHANRNFQEVMTMAKKALGSVMRAETDFPLHVQFSGRLHSLTVLAINKEFRRNGYKVDYSSINSQRDGPSHTFILTLSTQPSYEDLGDK
jgi:hypothetical protein